MVRSLLFSTFYWTFFSMMLVTVRFVGIEFFTGSPLNFPVYLIYINTIPGGVLMGIVWVVLEKFYFKKFLHSNHSFRGIILIKTITYFFAFVVVIFLSTLLMGGSLEVAIAYSFSPIAIGNLLASFIGAFILVFLQQMDRKMGPGMLTKYLAGKYYKPKEEERVFLFIDLKSSTTIAEKSGPMLYSQLIQDCFRELTRPVLDTMGEVYQYVGDEVIISWESKKALKDLNCIELFFKFQERLHNKRETFLKHHAAFPSFKAAASIGNVMVAEVGQLKSEIAFHGDVLNTTARVQGYCNELDEKFLITEQLYQRLDQTTKFKFKSHGSLELRGKAELVKVYGVYLDSEKSDRNS